MKWTSDWNKKFAYLPTKTVSNKWIWWKPYYRRKCLTMEVVDEPSNIEGYGMDTYYTFENATILDMLKL